jgi:SPASM domain peptide maturase of grasp-with-spasm system
LGEIQTYFDHAYDEIIEEYFDFLIQKKFGRWVKSLDKGFDKLNFSYEVPNTITNCIIDLDKNSKHPFPKIVAELDELICQALQLRFYDSITPTDLHHYLDYFKDSKIRGIEIILPTHEAYTPDVIAGLSQQHPRLLYLVFGSASSTIETTYHQEKLKVNYTTASFESASCCGYISSHYFRVNIKAFTEAKNVNSCLYKKIAIDKDGNISNCPSIFKKYGNIYKSSLIEVASMNDFKKLGGIKKDEISTCKDCEFRYICSDCRAYIKDSNDLYSKPLKCGYDPYTNVWENWSTNSIKLKTA